MGWFEEARPDSGSFTGTQGVCTGPRVFFKAVPIWRDMRTSVLPTLEGPGGTQHTQIGTGGSFSFGQMLPGTYTLQVATLAGVYAFPGYDPHEFALWSGRRYYLGNDYVGNKIFQDRNGHRWHLGQGVPVWFDPMGGSSWAETY